MNPAQMRWGPDCIMIPMSHECGAGKTCCCRIGPKLKVTSRPRAGPGLPIDCSTSTRHRPKLRHHCRIRWSPSGLHNEQFISPWPVMSARPLPTSLPGPDSRPPRAADPARLSPDFRFRRRDRTRGAAIRRSGSGVLQACCKPGGIVAYPEPRLRRCAQVIADSAPECPMSMPARAAGRRHFVALSSRGCSASMCSSLAARSRSPIAGDLGCGGRAGF